MPELSPTPNCLSEMRLLSLNREGIELGVESSPIRLIPLAGWDHEADWLAHLPEYLHTLLQNKNDNVKVVQELLRHGSSKVTLDVYAQVTPAKRPLQGKLVALLRQGMSNGL